MSTGITLAERGLVPTSIQRLGIRRLLRTRLRNEASRLPPGNGGGRPDLSPWLEEMASSAITLVPELANEQHYEVPAEFYGLVLGPHRKYSSCLFERGDEDLARAEAAMLDLTSRRAELANGQRILELGCGWGSLSLWMAKHLPDAEILSVSNSHSQREFVLAAARERGLHNLRVVTGDVAELDLGEGYDRVVSVEMFEHVRNWARLLGRIERSLAPGGKLFLHYFCHRDLAYPFEDTGRTDWMAHHFFSGGMMPSFDLVERVCGTLRHEASWRVGGEHYSRTAALWRENLDGHRGRVLDVLERTYGAGQAELWFQRWRLFFLACEELFGFRGSSEWLVAHHRLSRPGGPR